MLAYVPRPAAIVQSLPAGLYPDRSGKIESVVNVTKPGSYEVWLAGSFAARFRLSVDGHVRGAARHRLEHPGQYVPLGRLRLSRGRHTVELAYDGPSILHPGSAARLAYPIGPLVLSTTTAELPGPVCEAVGRTVALRPTARLARGGLVSFGILAVIVCAGLGGPLLALGRRGLVPVVVGELAAGVAVGKTGTHWVDAGQPTTAFLSAGRLRDADVHRGDARADPPAGDRRAGCAAASLAAVVVGALSVPAGIGIAAVLGGGHAAIYALLLASGSAAILLPVLEEQKLVDDERVLPLMAQVGIADVVAIVALPLVLQPSKARDAVLGLLAVAAAAGAIFALSYLVRGRELLHRIRRASKRRGWALDLRLALLALFTLAWIAIRAGTSILIAGFSVGLLVALFGGPKRLSTQVTGIAAGFFMPLFFVTLGAKLDLRARLLASFDARADRTADGRERRRARRGRARDAAAAARSARRNRAARPACRRGHARPAAARAHRGPGRRDPARRADHDRALPGRDRAARPHPRRRAGRGAAVNAVEATAAYERWLRTQLSAVLDDDLARKHERMAESASRFLRGDVLPLALARRAGSASRAAHAPELLAVGDLHVENFGCWRDVEGRLAWGVNDFDETATLPYTFDLLRLCTSALLAVREQHLPLHEHDVCAVVLDGYRASLEQGGEPFVAAERHAWLAGLAGGEGRGRGRVLGAA